VTTKISQRKKLQVLKHQLGISNTISVQPTTLTEYSPDNHHQKIAANIHRSPQLRRKEIEPHVDNLQKNWFGKPIKRNNYAVKKESNNLSSRVS
jgi:hypothetical protein